MHMNIHDTNTFFIQLYKNYLLIVINAVLWLYGLPMLLLSIRRFNHSCTCVKKLGKGKLCYHLQIHHVSQKVSKPTPSLLLLDLSKDLP